MFEQRFERDIRLHVSSDLQQLSMHAARRFMQVHALAENRFYIVPGGSTPVLFFTEVAKMVTDWRQTRFLLSDERLVSRDDPRCNQKLLADHFLKNVRGKERPTFFPMDTQAFTSGNLQGEFGKLNPRLAEWGIPQLAILGLGTDGHTASLFPGDELALAPSNQPWYLTTATNEPFGRVSLTFDYLCRARRIFFLVSGKEKANALAQCLEGDFRPGEFPAQMILQRYDRPIDVFCDEAAAGLLQELAASS